MNRCTQCGADVADTATNDPVRLPDDNLHTYIIDITGTGKSTIARSLIGQNIC